MASEDQMTSFYTALYHTCLSPTIYTDSDGRYRGLDQNIHMAEGFTNYTTFSLWDTYRALHPLFTILQQLIVNKYTKDPAPVSPGATATAAAGTVTRGAPPKGRKKRR